MALPLYKLYHNNGTLDFGKDNFDDLCNGCEIGYLCDDTKFDVYIYTYETSVFTDVFFYLFLRVSKTSFDFFSFVLEVPDSSLRSRSKKTIGR